MVPEGTNKAASFPNISATFSCNLFTVGSSSKTSSPNGAETMACFMESLGFVTVSERRSIVTDWVAMVYWYKTDTAVFSPRWRYWLEGEESGVNCWPRQMVFRFQALLFWVFTAILRWLLTPLIVNDNKIYEIQSFVLKHQFWWNFSVLVVSLQTKLCFFCCFFYLGW